MDCTGSPQLLEQLAVLQGYTELALLRLERDLPPGHPACAALRQVLAACTVLQTQLHARRPPAA